MQTVTELNCLLKVYKLIVIFRDVDHNWFQITVGFLVCVCVFFFNVSFFVFFFSFGANLGCT